MFSGALEESVCFVWIFKHVVNNADTKRQSSYHSKLELTLNVIKYPATDMSKGR